MTAPRAAAAITLEPPMSSHSNPNRIPLPGPIQEDEVKLEFTWRADHRTRIALERQARLMWFENPTEYMFDIIASPYER